MGSSLPGDRLALDQALANLVDNALRYGDGHGRARAHAIETATIELHVTDEGAGFDAEFLPAAFERFSRHDEARGAGRDRARTRDRRRDRTRPRWQRARREPRRRRGRRVALAPEAVE